jgi:hypothetical protein
MPNAVDLIAQAAKASPQPPVQPSASTETLARELSSGATDPRQGLRVPKIVANATK